MVDVDGRFHTNDTPLAAWLISAHGFDLLDTTDTDPVYFIFTNTPELKKAVRQWNMGEAMDNCCHFENAKKALNRKVKALKVGTHGEKHYRER